MTDFNSIGSIESTQVMIDIETMSTASDAAIISIGAVKFNTMGEVREAFSVNVSLQSSIDLGLRVDGATVYWWLVQSEAARLALTESKVSISAALVSLSNWLGKDSKHIKVWSNGADFDLPILTTAYKLADIKLPWAYRNTRCYRTLKSLYPCLDSSFPVTDKAKKAKKAREELAELPKYTAHTALGDAYMQAEFVCGLVKEGSLFL